MNVAALEAAGKVLMWRWRVWLGSFRLETHRLRQFVRTLWAFGIVFGVGFLYRHRKKIAASIRGGLPATPSPERASYTPSVHRHARTTQRKYVSSSGIMLASADPLFSSGLNTVRRTAGNVNDLMFSSSSLASGLAKDLRAYIYGDSGRTPQSLRRLIVLMSSNEVQQTLHGTAHAILAAFFSARRRDADKLAVQGT